MIEKTLDLDLEGDLDNKLYCEVYGRYVHLYFNKVELDHSPVLLPDDYKEDCFVLSTTYDSYGKAKKVELREIYDDSNQKVTTDE